MEVPFVGECSLLLLLTLDGGLDGCGAVEAFAHPTEAVELVTLVLNDLVVVSGFCASCLLSTLTV